jgi:metallo-beta-lactamase family protein
VDGARWIKLYNEKVRVKAKIFTINGFSAHADQNELLGWMGSFRRLGDVYLVHGEEEKEKALGKAIRKRLGKKVTIVEEAQPYRLDPKPRLKSLRSGRRKEKGKKKG